MAAGKDKEIYEYRWRTIKNVPRDFGAAWAQAFMLVASWIITEPFTSAPWLLLFALPVFILRAETRGGNNNRHRGGLAHRLSSFNKGDW